MTSLVKQAVWFGLKTGLVCGVVLFSVLTLWTFGCWGVK